MADQHLRFGQGMNLRSLRRWLFVAGLCSIQCVARTAWAQKESVNPGINKQFEKPNVKEFIGRFEHEGRDSFDHRNEIVRECQIKPGMTVADIGAGTGLFTRMFSPLVGPKGRVMPWISPKSSWSTSREQPRRRT